MNEAGEEIASDMAYGFGQVRPGNIYRGTTALSTYRQEYQEDGFNVEKHSLFSNKADFQKLPPLEMENSQPKLPNDADNTVIVRPDPVRIENMNRANYDKSRKAIYTRQQMYGATYKMPIKFTDWHIPISTGVDIWLFDKLSDEELFWDFEETASLYFAKGKLEVNLRSMIAKFRRNEGGVYEDPALTQAAQSNENTRIFCMGIEDEIADRLKNSNGKVSHIKDDLIYFANTFNKKYRRISYNNDKLGGLTIATNDIWAYEIALTEF